MEYARLPGTDLAVSRIALGCWTFSGGNRWGDVDDKVSVRAIHAALDAGINLFDTAEVYGNGRSEEVLGRGLSGRREHAIVATKVHYRNGHYRAAALMQACEDSLKRLGTDRIDLYQLHWPVFEGVEPEETAGALSRLLEQGKIRCPGVCNFGVSQLQEFLPHIRFHSNQLPYSPIWRGIEPEIVPATTEASLGILAYSGLVGGLLSGRYKDLEEVPEGRRKGKHLESPAKASVTFKAINRIDSIAAEAGLSTPKLVFSWILSRPGITAVLAGARTPEQVENNASVAPLEEAVIQEVTDATQELLDLHGPDPDFYQTPGRIR
jgi:aryl-alcohol dehydrogenase-like predicted oxidoreductase